MKAMNLAPSKSRTAPTTRLVVSGTGPAVGSLSPWAVPAGRHNATARVAINPVSLQQISGNAPNRSANGIGAAAGAKDKIQVYMLYLGVLKLDPAPLGMRSFCRGRCGPPRRLVRHVVGAVVGSLPCKPSPENLLGGFALGGIARVLWTAP